jgi:hypothetical protein
VLGLLFTAAGFYMMSRWSLDANWTQMTISTLTAGLGFGLVIAPISTTAINAVRANQAGMGSAIVTALRMVGMILGLAALTSWGLAYFKQLAAQFRPLPYPATPAQFAQWTSDYTQHVIVSAHTAYCAIFFVTMVLCLIALIPACFLWGRQPVLILAELPLNHSLHGGAMYDSTTAIGDVVTQDATAMADETMAVAPAFAPYSPVNQLPFPRPQRPQPRRRLVLTLICIGVAMLLLGTGLLAFIFWPASSNTSTIVSATTPTATPITGPRMIDLALNNTALTSIFVSELGTSDGTLSDMQANPLPNNALSLKFNLNINASGLQRTLPVEIDAAISVDAQHNLQLKVTRVTRDGIDAGPGVAASMQTALNQMLQTTVMPALHAQLQKAELVGVQTSSTVSCGGGQEMLILLLQAPPLQGGTTQTTPTTLCFTKAVNLNNLVP